MDSTGDVQEFHRKHFFYPFSRSFKPFVLGVAGFLLAVYGVIYHIDSNTFTGLLFGIVGFALSVVLFVAIPKKILVSDKGIDIDGDFCSWNDIRKVSCQLSTLDKAGPRLEITLNDGDFFYITLYGFNDHELLARKILGVAKSLGKSAYK